MYDTYTLSTTDGDWGNHLLSENPFYLIDNNPLYVKEMKQFTQLCVFIVHFFTLLEQKSCYWNYPLQCLCIITFSVDFCLILLCWQYSNYKYHKIVLGDGKVPQCLRYLPHKYVSMSQNTQKPETVVMQHASVIPGLSRGDGKQTEESTEDGRLSTVAYGMTLSQTR